jgi:putative PIN family toxin of toxin-antitoxin system
LKPRRVVLDTNCVLSALLFEAGRLAWLRQAWQQGTIVPLASRPTVGELIRVLAYPRFRLEAQEQETLLAEYLPWVEPIGTPPAGTWPWLRDPADAMFLDLALAAAADALVSGDADLRHASPDLPQLKILTPAELRAALRIA